jgi:hypothetical protein
MATPGKYAALFDDYVPPVARENKAGPYSEEQQAKDWALSRDPLAEGDADIGDPRWQRLTGHTPEDEAERERQTEAREFLKFAGMGAAGELATPLVARGVTSVADRARAIQAARAASRPAPVVSDPAAMTPVEMGPRIQMRPDFWVPRDGDMGPDLFETPSTLERTANIRLPRPSGATAPEMGRLNAEGAKGGALAASTKIDPETGLPFPPARPGYPAVYRGMSEDEFNGVVQNGHILSDGRFSHPSEGTSFARDYADAESYTNFGRTDPAKTGRPNYVVEVEHGPGLTVDPRDGYIKSGVKTPVPASNIRRVWRFASRESPEEGSLGQGGFVARRDGGD